MPIYWDKDAERFNYLMVTPSGARVEFRQLNGASDTFETADSSYTQLKTTGAANPNEPVENISITVTTTDGTQMKYEWKAGAFRCSQIKDRNGNYLTINHDEQGLLRTVTDTLGRIITVNYDNELYPTSITQTWKNDNGAGSNVTQTWATFAYTTTTIDTNFDSSLTVVGPADNTVLKVLQKITYPNGGFTQFDYNGYGQVWKIRNVAADSSSHILNYVRTNLESPSSNQTDCPRFTETRSWTENFNQDQNGTPQEIIVTNTTTENASYNLPDGHNGTATKIEVSMANHPQGAVSKTFVGSSGWMEGLTVATEDWANGTSGTERKRWTWNDWTQDDTNLNYIQNPRIIESKVGDTTNVKRTTTEYRTIPLTTIAEYGLVNAVYVYDADQTTILKKVETDYNLSSAYLSRRIIGLPSEVRAYGRESGALSLVSKVSYTYDEFQFNTSGLEQNISPAYHDTNYGASFVIGRGNLTSTTRHDISGQTSSVTSSVKYNTAGAPVAQIDPLGRIVKINYTDQFNDDNNSRNTYAYPTKLTDPAGNFSEAKYRFDIGANVWAKSPTPQGANNNRGKETERIYDSVGRLERETLVNHGGAYTRYEYPANGIQSKIFATLTTGAGEVMSERWTDGAGRVRYARTEHPGSAGGWSGSKVEYDILGRVTRSTVPTEINPVTPTNPSTWTPTGDDDRGLDTNNNPVWLWTSAEYDWQGRLTRKINTDGTDRLISYDGCGCAGGLVTTIQSELVPRDDQPTTNARRKQKVYADILGREYKSEVFDWNGNVYSTTVQTFNGRDQITQTTQYAGTENPGNTQQISTMTYDGHGRLKTRHNPIEDGNTTWTYNADDTIQQIIDPRGAITNFTYNDPRGLLTQISYDPPATQPTYTTIPDAPTVQFQYDNAGNRISMTTEGVGSTTYNYDELSRLTSETKTFTGLTGNFTIGYSYELSGKLKSVTDPFGAVVNYNDDKAGRTTSVTGSGFLDVATYAGNIKYRAFGGVKEMTYGSSDNSRVSYQFDNRLRVSSYESTSTVRTGGYVRRATYEYFDDGKTKKVNNLIDSGFDRTNKYDYMGRLTSNGFGMKTNNQSEQVQTYSQTIGYDAFSEMTSRLTGVWGEGDGFTASYVNGRKQNSNEIYDALGNIVDKTTSSTVYDRWKFDAAGRMAESVQRYYQGAPQQTSFDRTNTISQSYDGDGKSVKRVDHLSSRNVINNQTYVKETVEYFARSSVLGKVLTELDAQGAKKVTYVYTGEAVLAEQRNFPATAGPPPTSAWSEVFWKHEDIITGSYRKIARSGQEISMSDPPSSAEFEPLGGIVPQSDPNISDELGGALTPADYRFGGNVHSPEFGCEMDRLPIPCNLLRDALRGYRANGVGTRTQGMEGGWGDLGSIVSIWKFNKYLKIDDEDKRLTKEIYKDTEFWSSLTKLKEGYGLLVDSWYEATITPLGDMLIDHNQQQQTGQPAPLNEKEKKTFKTRVDKINKKIRKKKCRDFLESKLGKSIVEKISEVLANHQAFSGPRSTDITTVEAGILSQEEVARMNGLIESDPGSPAAKSARYELNRSVAKYFEDNDKDNRKVQAAVGNYNGNPNTAFYRSFDSIKILHETLHIATGKGDDELAKALGINITPFEGDPELASNAITETLKANGCKP